MSLYLKHFQQFQLEKKIRAPYIQLHDSMCWQCIY